MVVSYHGAKAINSKRLLSVRSGAAAALLSFALLYLKLMFIVVAAHADPYEFKPVDRASENSC